MRCVVLSVLLLGCVSARPAPGDASRTEPRPCTTSDDCSGGSCHGPEGCEVAWTCVPPRMCLRDLVQYCGCDGETFLAGSNCPTRPYRHRGACTQP